MESWSDCLDLDRIAADHGTPLYLTNINQLGRNLDRFVSLVGKPSCVAYPVKANPSLSVLVELARLGAAADCASEIEVKLAAAAGFGTDRIIYNSPAPDHDLLIALLKSGVAVVADSEPILRMIDECCLPGEIAGRLLVRINPKVDLSYLKHTAWEESVAHASDNSKFGIPSEEIVPLLQTIRVPVSGIHLHVGTQMDNLDSFLRALELLHSIVDQIHEKTDQTIDSIDLGGGLGIPFQDDQLFPTIDEYASKLRPHLRNSFHYLVEPGHALVGDAVALLARIREVKCIRSRRWAILDVGSDQLVKVTLLNWYHRIRDARGRTLPQTGDDAVAGPHCFAGDLLLPHTDLQDLQRGDTLLIQHVGAYCHAIANNFNGIFAPSQAIVDDYGRVERITNVPEDWFFENNIQSYRWFGEEELTPTSIDLGLVESLSSTYLRIQAAEDSFEFESVGTDKAGLYRFIISAHSPLGLLSMPLATRIAGDAVIIAGLHHLGRQMKDVSVWGIRQTLTANKAVSLDSPIELIVRIVPFPSYYGHSRATYLARWTVRAFDYGGSFLVKV